MRGPAHDHDIAPSTLDLAGLELELGQERDRAFRLRNAIAPVNAGAPGEVSDDFDQDPRSDGLPDIGADELAP